MAEGRHIYPLCQPTICAGTRSLLLNVTGLDTRNSWLAPRDAATSRRLHAVRGEEAFHSGATRYSGRPFGADFY